MGNKRNRNKERKQACAAAQGFASEEFDKALRKQRRKAYGSLALESVVFLAAALATTNMILSNRAHTQYTEHRTESIEAARLTFQEACEADVNSGAYVIEPGENTGSAIAACTDDKATGFVDEGATRMAELHAGAKKRSPFLLLAFGLMFVLTHSEYRKLRRMENDGPTPSAN